MRAWFTSARRWSPPHTRLHFYLTPVGPGGGGVVELATRCQAVMAPWQQVLPPIPPPWLHVTVQAITHVGAGQVGAQQRQALIDAATAALADVRAWDWSIGSPLLGSSAVMLDTSPDQAFTALHAALQAAAWTVFGTQVPLVDTRPAHITLAYATADSDTDRLGSLLRRVRPSHTTWHVDRVHLVDVHQDPDAGYYRWTPVAELPLAP